LLRHLAEGQYNNWSSGLRDIIVCKWRVKAGAVGGFDSWTN